jgi:hypothetical protein
VPRKSADRASARERLLAAASELFYDEGVHTVGIDRVISYVTGFTGSIDFPTTVGALQTRLRGGDNAFVSKLNAAGSALLYSTYLGGSGVDEGSGIALDPAGSAYITGFTGSANFPTTAGAFQAKHAQRHRDGPAVLDLPRRQRRRPGPRHPRERRARADRGTPRRPLRGIGIAALASTALMVGRSTFVIGRCIPASREVAISPSSPPG